ncbi:MAG: inositol monophosphatase [Geminicoccaceae bacterium]|nr:MAG: inositol monophosphatase [Geminicoccaceae bacterium]
MTLTAPDLDARFAVAGEVMREAGALALDFFRRREELAVESKGLQDVVSIADRAVETLIRDRLRAAFPGDGFVGEEHGAEGDPARCWVIDPIDGTQNFLRGIPYWTVVLAFVVDGRTELSFTGDPVHGEMFSARRGQGVWRDGGEVRCRRPERLDQCCVALSFGFKDDWRHYVEVQGRFLEHGVDMRRLGSTALILAHIADGRLDAIYAPGNQSWDCLAGLLLVQEAGGVAVDFLADTGLLARGPVVATVPVLRELAQEVTGVRLI